MVTSNLNTVAHKQAQLNQVQNKPHNFPLDYFIE